MSWTEPILHVDMDSFYVEVERLSRPDLAGVPVAVGGAGTRGVVASASYEARRFGVHSAQPTAVARRLCPDLVVIPSNHVRYTEKSSEVFAIFREFTPLVEGLSLDEAFLDVSGLRRHASSSVDVGRQIRARIKDELGLPASVGVAGVKYIAKLASEQAKPDGLRHVPVGSQLQFLHPLSVDRMWGVGPAMLAALERLGIETIGDLAAIQEAVLVGAVGQAAGHHLHELAAGRDPRQVVPDASAKSLSVEETFATDLTTRDTVEAALLGQSQRLSGRLRRAGLRARTINLKVRYADFRIISRSRTLQGGIDGSRDIYHLAVDLVDAVDISQPVRLLGLGGSNLETTDTPSQIELSNSPGWDSVEHAVADVRDRFGPESVRPARLLRGADGPDHVQEP